MNKDLPTFEPDLDNKEFMVAQNLIERTDQSVFLTGKAGTGKSTFLTHITRTTKKKYVVLAPTGIAAVSVAGQTLHSFFKIPLKPLLPHDPDFSVTRLRARLRYPKSLIKLIKSIDLIIIDEISMVRADVVDFIDRVLRVYTGNMRQPFGGKQMLFVGDIFQLEPVVTGNDRDVLAHAYSSFYFFNAAVFKELQLIPIELTKVYRQEEKSFVSMLDNIRMGLPTQEDIKMLNSRYVKDSLSDSDSENFTMTIATRRDMVDTINERHLNALPTPSVTFKGVIEKDFPENALPTDLNLELKVGAQVVFIKNDPEHRWVNGTVAVVTKCGSDGVMVRTEDGEEHEVEYERWSNVKYTYDEKTHRVDELELGAFMQLPLKLAWALTIHKSQGLTFNRVIIDMGKGAFAGGQTYVALSRCRTLEGITLTNPITPRDIYVKRDIVNFASKYNNDSLIEEAFDRSKADALFKSANARFKKGLFAEATSLFTEALALRPEIIKAENVRRLLRLKSYQAERYRLLNEKLVKELEADRERFLDIADKYVEAADELCGGGWEIESAIAQYDKALKIFPGHTGALLGKAEVNLRMNNVSEALELYKAVAETDSNESWKGLLGIGDILRNEGDEFGAISNYLKAHDLTPRQPEPLKRLVEIYEEVEDFESSEFYRKKLARLKKK